MNANLSEKEVYPVVLFFLLLMTWSLVSASGPAETVNSLRWNPLTKISNSNESCADNFRPHFFNPFCKDEHELAMTSPVIQQHDIKQHLTRAESKVQIRKQ